MISFCPLEIGSRGALRIRYETVIAECSPHRLLYVSDLHLSRRTDHIARQLIAIVRTCNPDLLLLGGDLVDQASGLHGLFNLLKDLVNMSTVWAVPGNHDGYAGCTHVRSVVETAGGVWLAESIKLHKDIQISGSVSFVPDPEYVSILCAHYPSDFEQAVQRGYDLILAGHLHGSQVHFSSIGGRSYPGALVYRWNGEQFTRGKTRMLVSRGINDTIPIRWNCPREVILCAIN